LHSWKIQYHQNLHPHHRVSTYRTLTSAGKIVFTALIWRPCS
jgi:hypothetical protein